MTVMPHLPFPTLPEGAHIEPECCGLPMVHNSWTGEWECADAYFGLIDDKVLGDFGLIVEQDTLTTHQAERYEHWRAVRVPDGHAVRY